MLLFLILAILVIFGLLTYIAMRDDWDNILTGILSLLLIVAIASSIVMGMVAIAVNINTDAKLAEKQERYDSLTYQLDNGLFEEGNSVARKQLYDQIQEWNEDLAKGRKSKQNPWVGIFYAPIYDQFDFIRLPEPEHN